MNTFNKYAPLQAQSGLMNRIASQFVVFIPFFWVVLFFLVPLLIILKISFAEPIIHRPPFTDLFSFIDGKYIQLKITIESYLNIINESIYIKSFLTSLRIAFVSTFFCLIIGYPLAYGITRLPEKKRFYFLLLIILPFWTSFLIRAYAWIGLLKEDGIINTLLLKLGLISENLPLLNNELAVYIGIVYAYLPFMVLSLYGSLMKVDESLLEAAADLGCKPYQSFLKVTLPLSIPGIIAGSMLVFIPAVGEFVIPDLLGGPGVTMVGKTLWTEFFLTRDWPTASALAIILLIVLMIPIAILQYIQRKASIGQNS
jgi:putrescine transport system permease protein